MVHKGFWQSWCSKGVRSKVFDTVAQIMASQGKLAHSMDVFVTGKDLASSPSYQELFETHQMMWIGTLRRLWAQDLAGHA